MNRYMIMTLNPIKIIDFIISKIRNYPNLSLDRDFPIRKAIEDLYEINLEDDVKDLTFVIYDQYYTIFLSKSISDRNIRKKNNNFKLKGSFPVGDKIYHFIGIIRPDLSECNIAKLICITILRHTIHTNWFAKNLISAWDTYFGAVSSDLWVFRSIYRSEGRNKAIEYFKSTLMLSTINPDDFDKIYELLELDDDTSWTKIMKILSQYVDFKED